MIYPDFIKPGDVIGVTAPSDGNKKETDFRRLDHGKEALGLYGFPVKETSNVRISEKGRSACAKERAREFMELVEDDAVKAIISAKGGDYLVEMLSLLDFDVIREHPVWFQGYSDNTGLTFTITTLCDIATIYGNNFNDFGMEDWHEAVENNFEILRGSQVKQTSFDFYEDGFYDKVTGLEGYTLTEPVNWVNARGEEALSVSGRLLGGCLDVLLNLCGTKYDKVKEFNAKYEEDGILWYLESFALNSEALTIGLWHLKEAGWFDTAKGFVFGRPCFYESEVGTSYQEAVLSVLGELNVPIILEADIGHKAPQFTVINGAMGIFQSAGGRGTFVQQYK